MPSASGLGTNKRQMVFGDAAGGGGGGAGSGGGGKKARAESDGSGSGGGGSSGAGGAADGSGAHTQGSALLEAGATVYRGVTVPGPFRLIHGSILAAFLGGESGSTDTSTAPPRVGCFDFDNTLATRNFRHREAHMYEHVYPHVSRAPNEFEAVTGTSPLPPFLLPPSPDVQRPAATARRRPPTRDSYERIVESFEKPERYPDRHRAEVRPAAALAPG